MSAQATQAEFMKLAGQELGLLKHTLDPRKPVPKTAQLYINLIQEEVDELYEGFNALMNATYEDERRVAVREVLDDAADLLYVLAGFCNTLGLPLEFGFQEVHNANMSKGIRQEDGSYKLLYRDDGKVLKPENWQEPNIDRVIDIKLIQDAHL